ncbi:MAG: SGNH/GDSL hydrolase family protein [Fibrobacter sp.]|nr:SGNH/GDSL hydrolase family protein [Fibrobacter sp.]
MAGYLVPGDNDVFTFSGRCDFTTTNQVSFDWPGIAISFGFSGTSCTAAIDGPGMFDLFIDSKFVKTVRAVTENETVLLADKLKNKAHDVKLVKRNESFIRPVVFRGVIIDNNAEIFKITQNINRKIEFIGDSYTAGYANEYSFRECANDETDSIVFSMTNSVRSFGSLIAGMFNAERHINAISGKGLVRNFGGADKDKEFLKYYERTLLTSVHNPDVNSALWDYSWHPDVIVIGLGINDFQENPPYADTLLFDNTYQNFIQSLKARHPGVEIICCATKIKPLDTLIPRVCAVVEYFMKKGDNGVHYFEYETENTSLYGHPSVKDHKKIAYELSSFIGTITGWR